MADKTDRLEKAKKEMKEKTQVYDWLRESMKEALIQAGLSENSVLLELQRIMFEGTRDTDRLRAQEIWAKLTGSYAPERKQIDIKDISIGVDTPDDVDI